MTVTSEPRGLNWINNINTNSFGSLVSQVCWLVGSLVLTLACYRLLMAPTELARQAGIFLAGILVTAWTGKTVAGVFDSNNKRKANPAYKDVLEAKERGKIAGAAAAQAIKQGIGDGVQPTTREPQAQVAPLQQTTVNVGEEAVANGKANASKPTGDARVDDERGEGV
jgi:hypothetical protein